MTREELKSHLQANEAKVEQMTTEVSSKIDQLDQRLDHLGSAIEQQSETIEASNEAFKAEVRQDLGQVEESNKWTYRLVGITLSLLVVFIGAVSLRSGQSGGGGLFGFDLGGLGTVLIIALTVALAFLLIGALMVGFAARRRDKSFLEWFLMAFTQPVSAIQDLREEDSRQSGER